MNANDIAAAKRLIAQFEGRADGRHNSTALAARETEMKPVKVEGQASPQRHWARDLSQALQEHFRESIREERQGSIGWLPGDFARNLRRIWNSEERVWMTVRDTWQQCEIGDVVIKIGGFTDQPYLRMPEPTRPQDFYNVSSTEPLEFRVQEYSIREYRPIRISHRPSLISNHEVITKAWRRTK